MDRIDKQVDRLLKAPFKEYEAFSGINWDAGMEPPDDPLWEGGIAYMDIELTEPTIGDTVSTDLQDILMEDAYNYAPVEDIRLNDMTTIGPELGDDLVQHFMAEIHIDVYEPISGEGAAEIVGSIEETIRKKLPYLQGISNVRFI